MQADSARIGRRTVLKGGALGVGVLAAPALAQRLLDLGLPGGSSMRPLVSDFPEKGEMILQRARPPLLETPMQVFDEGVFTPNARFFVRWHWASVPTTVDLAAYHLKVRGAVSRPLSLSLEELLALPRTEIAAVNQCSGNSRGFFEPRVPGAQWGHGAMGNARWMGVALRHVLDLAGLRLDAIAVRFGGLDMPLVDGAPRFEKSISVDHARNGEVLLAFAMNGEQLPLLNGFPLRLVVPGWYSTYWVKALDDIEVLAGADDRYWMAKAYQVPDNPGADVAPGTGDFPTVAISRMVPRSWITNLADGDEVPVQPALMVRGIALGGDTGVARVEISTDGGASWQEAELGANEGKYSFRRFEAKVNVPAPGPLALLTRCTNQAGMTQPLQSNWNPGGLMRTGVNSTTVEAVPA